MRPLRSGCRVRVLTQDTFGGRIGTAYLTRDSIPDDVGLGGGGFVLVFFVPDHKERAAFTRALASYSAFADYHGEKFNLGEQYIAPIASVEVLSSGTRRGKRHRMRVKL